MAGPARGHSGRSGNYADISVGAFLATTNYARGLELVNAASVSGTRNAPGLAALR